MAGKKYGRFEQNGKRYILETQTPPRRWMNVHFSGSQDNEYYSYVDTAGMGTVVCRDRIGNINNLICEDHKTIFLRDDENNKCWNIGQYPLPAEVTGYRCEYTPAATTLSSSFKGIHASQRVFVPAGATHEIWTLTIKNTSKKNRTISVFAHVEFDLRGFAAPRWYTGHPNHLTEFQKAMNGVLALNKNPYCTNDRYNGFLVASRTITKFDCDRENLYGPLGTFYTPQITNGWNATNQNCNTGGSCATLEHRLNLKPGREVRIDYALGQTGSKREAVAVYKKISKTANIEKMLKKVEAMEEKSASGFQIQTGEKRIDYIMNYWVKKQMRSYIVYKSGYRDSLQIHDALCMSDYDTAVQDCMHALSCQYTDGHAPHHYRPLDELQFSDHPAWIMLAVPGLIKESGDFSLLNRKVGYLHSKEKGTVWNHMIRAMRWLAKDTGKYGLCLQHYADWNDSLDGSRVPGPRESIFVSQQLCYGALRMQEIAKRIGDTKIKNEAARIFKVFKDRLNKVAWDGGWYIRSICQGGPNGEKKGELRLGSKKQKGGKIFLNTQSWAVISESAPRGRGLKALQAVDKMLEIDVGIRSCYPPIMKYDRRIGRVSAVSPNRGQNGGVYNHAPSFKIVADAMLGRGEEAWRTVQKILPGSKWNPISRSGSEPFTMTNSYKTSEPWYGRGGSPWKTGTAAWVCKGILEWILGVRREYDGLLMDPCLPKHMKKARVLRKFRGARYDIKIDNRAGRCNGVSEIKVDGKVIKGNILPDFRDGKMHKVNVTV